MEDGARDVVRQVGDDVVWRPDELRHRLVEHVALDQAQATRGTRIGAPGLERPVEPASEALGEAAVELDRDDRCARIEEGTGQHTETGPDFEDHPGGRRRGLGNDPLEDVDVRQEVL
jgi:hypothetical protein